MRLALSSKMPGIDFFLQLIPLLKKLSIARPEFRNQLSQKRPYGLFFQAKTWQDFLFNKVGNFRCNLKAVFCHTICHLSHLAHDNKEFPDSLQNHARRWSSERY